MNNLNDRFKQILLEKANINGYGFSDDGWGDLMGGKITRRRRRRKHIIRKAAPKKKAPGEYKNATKALQEYNKLLRAYKKRVGYVPGCKEELAKIKKIVSREYKRDGGIKLMEKIQK